MSETVEDLAQPEVTPPAVRRRRWPLRLLMLAGAVVLVVVAAAATIDPRPLLERRASDMLGRAVTIDAAVIHWGRAPSLEVRGVRVANPAGTRDLPDFLTVAHGIARLDLPPLLRGRLQLRSLELDKPSVALVRDDDGSGSWDLTAGIPDPVPLLQRMPRLTILDATLTDASVQWRGRFTVHLTSGELTLHTDSAGAPVTVKADATVDGVPVHADAILAPLANFRGDGPADIDLTVTAAGATARLIGVAPTDSGVRGQFSFAADKLGSLTGMLTQARPAWRLSGMHGEFGGGSFTGNVSLFENPGTGPDDLALVLDFASLDLRTLLAEWGGQGVWRTAKLPVNVAARVAATRATFGSVALAAVDLDAALVPGRLSVAGLSFTAADGRAVISGDAETAGAGLHVAAKIALTGADAAQLAPTLGLDATQLAGKVDARLSFDVTGDTLAEALKAGRVDAVLAMTQGRLSREALEAAAPGLKAIIRKAAPPTRVACVLAVVELRNGTATLAPARWRTSDGSFIAAGTLDPVQAKLDVIMRSEGVTPGFFTLDTPQRLTLEDTGLTIQPTVRANMRNPDAQAAAALKLLPADLAAMAGGNSCVR